MNAATLTLSFALSLRDRCVELLFNILISAIYDWICVTTYVPETNVVNMFICDLWYCILKTVIGVIFLSFHKIEYDCDVL